MPRIGNFGLGDVYRLAFFTGSMGNVATSPWGKAVENMTSTKHLFFAKKSRNSSFSTRNSYRVLGLYGKQMEIWWIEARKI